MEGLEVYNDDGTLKFTTADRLTRILDVFSTGSASGSRVVSGLDTGTPFVSSAPSNQANTTFFPLISPRFTINAAASTVSWEMQPGAQPCRVTVAVY